MSTSTIPPAEIAYQTAHISDDRSPQLYTICCVFLAIATTAVILRFYSRHLMKASLQLDDWTALGGLVGLYGIFTSYTVFIWCGKLGKHFILSTTSSTIIGLKSLYAFNIVYTLTIPLVKISVLLLYYRVFHTRHFKWVVYFGITFMILFALSTVLVDIFNCNPIRASWDKTIPAKCVDPVILYRSTAIINLVTDILILCTPAPMVWRLNMSIRNRLALYSIFLLGGLVCIATGLRLPTFSQINYNDLTYTYVNVGIWTYIEVSMAVTCACLPTLRPFFRAAIHNSLYSLRSRSTTTHSLTQGTHKSSHASSSEPDQHEMQDAWNDPSSVVRPAPIVRKNSQPYLAEKASSDGDWKMTSEDDPLPLQGIQVRKDIKLTRSNQTNV